MCVGGGRGGWALAIKGLSGVRDVILQSMPIWTPVSLPFSFMNITLRPCIQHINAS